MLNAGFIIAVLAAFACGFMAARDHYAYRHKRDVRQLERELELVYKLLGDTWRKPSTTPHADDAEKWLWEKNDGC